MGMQTWSTDLPLSTSCPHRTSKTTPSLIPSSSTSTHRQNSNSEVAGDPSSWQHGINGPQVINLIYRDLANHTTGPAAVQEYNAPALGSISKMRGPTPTQNPNYSPHLSSGRCWPCVPHLASVHPHRQFSSNRAGSCAWWPRTRQLRADHILRVLSGVYPEQAAVTCQDRPNGICMGTTAAKARTKNVWLCGIFWLGFLGDFGVWVNFFFVLFCRHFLILCCPLDYHSPSSVPTVQIHIRKKKHWNHILLTMV